MDQTSTTLLKKPRKEFNNRKKTRCTTWTKYNQNNYHNIFTELQKIRSRKGRKNHDISDSKLMLQLHHFGHLKKSITSTKSTVLNLNEEAKAILENDFIKLINSKDCQITAAAAAAATVTTTVDHRDDFIIKPLVLNKDTCEGFTEDNHCIVSSDNSASIFKQIEYDYRRRKENIDESNQTHEKSSISSNFEQEIKDLVLKTLSNRDEDEDETTANPLSIACRDCNRMINVKDYNRLYYNKIIETRQFINGISIYHKLRQHYGGIPVSRNCFKKKYFNKLNQLAIIENFPDMETSKVLSPGDENTFLQNIIEYYEEQEAQINSIRCNIYQEQNNVKRIVDESSQRNNNEDNSFVFNPVENVTKNMNSFAINLDGEQDGEQEARCSTPVNEELSEYFSPESFETPPSQRLIPEDLCSTVSKYQTMFYEKDSIDGVASLYEIPKNYEKPVNASNINRSVLKRIDLLNENVAVPSCSGTNNNKRATNENRIETARLITSGKIHTNDLECLENINMLTSPGNVKSKHAVKKCLFQLIEHNSNDADDQFDFHPLNYSFEKHADHSFDEGVFIRPKYSPKEFNELKGKLNTITKEKHALYSSDEYLAKKQCHHHHHEHHHHHQSSLKVDELEFNNNLLVTKEQSLLIPGIKQFQSSSSKTLSDILETKTPKHKYYPFYQFDRN